MMSEMAGLSDEMSQVLADLELTQSVDGIGATFTSLQRRHKSCCASQAGRARWFMKQGDGRTGFGTVAHEAAAYLALRDLADLREHLPGFVGYHKHSDTLVLDWLPMASRFDEAIRSDQVSTADWHRLGRALASLHVTDHTSSALEHLGTYRTARILTFHDPAPRHVAEFSQTQAELVSVLRSQTAIVSALEELDTSWQSSHLVHFDLRLTNVLIGENDLRLIDLEFLGRGDPRWDLGSLVAAILEEWLLSAPLGDRGGYRSHLGDARFSKLSADQAIRAALDGYKSVLSAPDISDRDVARFAGARLVHAAYEFATCDAEEGPSVASLAALGVDLLLTPEMVFDSTMSLR